MSRKRPFVFTLALGIMLLSAAAASAQRFTPFGVLLDDDFHPFGPEGQFAENFQPFAPAGGLVAPYGGGPDPKVGFFFTFDRMQMSASRPNNRFEEFKGDWTWGNRIDLGYMTEDDHGWLAEFIHINGPNVPPPPEGGTAFSVNSADLHSGEVSKQWRLEPFHRGSLVEVFVGARYSLLQSRSPGFRVQNNMIGPQAGLKWYKQKGRWTISTEGRYYFPYNVQFFDASAANPLGFDENRWVHAGDLRLEVKYTLYKQFALNVGWEMLYFANGVARGVPPNNDQDMYFTGVVFGFNWNR